jgi:hypothetical protein
MASEPKISVYKKFLHPRAAILKRYPKEEKIVSKR